MIKEVREKYQKLALKDYDKNSNRYFADRRSDEISKRVSGRTLEVGAGTGLVAMEILDLTSEMVVTDLSVNMLKKLLEKETSFKGVVADAEYLPFKNGVFDTVVSSEMIYYLKDQTFFISDANRVLAENGTVVITAFSNLWKIFQLIRIWLEKLGILKMGICDSFVIGSSRGLLCKQLREKGLKNISVAGKILVPLGAFHFLNTLLEKTVFERLGFFFIITGKK